MRPDIPSTPTSRSTRLSFSLLSNQTNFLNNNQTVRNMYSPGQIRQTMSVYHTNYMNRMDTAYLLHYGQTPCQDALLRLVHQRRAPVRREHHRGHHDVHRLQRRGLAHLQRRIDARGCFNITYFTSESATEYASGG